MRGGLGFTAALLLICLPCSAVRGQTQAAPAPADAALVARFATAASEDDRAALVRAHPEMGDPSFRTAIIQYGNDYLRHGEFSSAEQTFNSLLWLGTTLGNRKARSSAL